jgi:hypothetical protein
MDNIYKYIRSQRAFYETETIPLQEGDEFSQFQTLRKVDLYWRNKYVNVAWDRIIGDFPFDNVSKYRVLLEARATDFDQKHFEVPATNSSRKARIASMIATKSLTKHMDDIKFSKTLNDICITRPKYGGVLLKRVKENVVVVPWQNVITDPTELMSGVIIERYYVTPSELLKMGWDKALVREAIEGAVATREKTMAQGGQGEAETQGVYIEIYEAHGDIPLSMYKATRGEDYEDEDVYEYVKAHIVLANPEMRTKINESTGQEETEEMGVVFYCETEKEVPYKFLARNPIAGRAIGEGVVEALFEHQKWHNFLKTEEMRMAAVAGKKLYWTDDPDILANIFSEGVDHGHVLRVTQGSTLQELNQIPTGLPMYQNIKQEWSDSADKTSSSFSANIGEEAKSGTPFRAQYLQNVEASSQFEQYREEIGIFLQEVCEDWLLPDALKKAASKGEIYDTFTMQELQLIDEVIVEASLTDELIKKTLEGEVIDPMMVDALRAGMQSSLRKEGSKRSITDIAKFIVEAGKFVRVHTTDEARNKAVLFESYSNLLALLDPTDPRFNALIDKVMQSVGITREELELYNGEAMQAKQGQIKQEEMQAQEMPRGQAAMSRV